MPANPLLKSSSCYTVKNAITLFGTYVDPIAEYERVSQRYIEASLQDTRLKELHLAKQSKLREILEGKTSKYATCKSFVLAANLFAADNGRPIHDHHETIDCHEYWIPSLKTRLQNVIDKNGNVMKWAGARDALRAECYARGLQLSTQTLDAIASGHRTLQERCAIIVESCKDLFPRVELQETNAFQPQKGKKSKVQVLQPSLFHL